MLTAANISSIEGEEVYEVLIGDYLDGLGGHSAQYCTSKVRQALDSYKCVAEGGWLVQGVDPLDDCNPMAWVRFKPDHPRKDYKKPDKIVKYESPRGGANRATFFKVPWRIGFKVAKRAGLQKEYGKRFDAFCQKRSSKAFDSDSEEFKRDDLETLDGEFWLWVRDNPQVIVCLTEGEKKAGALLSLGFAAIGIPGIRSGYRTKDRLGKPINSLLIPEIELFAIQDRTFHIVFDQEVEPQKQYGVQGAILKLGYLLKKGFVEVRVVEWLSEFGKGIDDLLVSQGQEGVVSAINQSWEFLEFQAKLALDHQLTRMPDIVVNMPTLEHIAPESIPDEGIIAISSAMGTGKTKTINNLLKDEDTTLLAGHRIALMRNLCERLNLVYRGDLDWANSNAIKNGEAFYSLKVGTCVDSLLHPLFNPQNFEEGNLVIDEACQVIRHLLTSNTCSRDGMRGPLLKRLEALVKVAKRVIIADADLSNDIIKYFERLRGEGSKAFLLRNNYKPAGWEVEFVQCPNASVITARILQDAVQGKKLFIATDSLKSSKRIKKLIDNLECMGKRVLIINSETSGGDIEQEFIQKPDENLVSFDIVITTPSMATGVSIESNHFDKVFGVFYGASSTDADMLQALSRVRNTVPRTIWCKSRGQAFSPIGKETSPRILKKKLHEQTTATAIILQHQLTTAAKEKITDYPWENPNIDLWCRLEASRNSSMLNLRAALKVRLLSLRHQVRVLDVESDSETQKILRQATQNLNAEQAHAIANSINLTDAEAARLAESENLQPEERLALEKWKIAHFYAVPFEKVTADFVLADDGGIRRLELSRLEALLDEDVANDRDLKILNQQAKSDGMLTPWDFSVESLKRFCREQLGLTNFISPGTKWCLEDLKDFKEKALRYRKVVKHQLGIQLREDMSATAMLGMLLRQLGLKTQSKQVRKDGRVTRYYQLDVEVMRESLAILQRRRQRREEEQGLSHTPLVSNKLWGVCDRLETKQDSTFQSIISDQKNTGSKVLAPIPNSHDRVQSSTLTISLPLTQTTIPKSL
ncbi:plasmid replication protein, CyRepA1 family [Nodosilinea sp. AN01ver1]|uniref:plasmid replication protein, CyRepA1 family n=1 Tax=Nodosilinea sp. AN01ver1 TaxID=3423362 RepID=UPI003D3120D3